MRSSSCVTVKGNKTLAVKLRLSWPSTIWLPTLSSSSLKRSRLAERFMRTLLSGTTMRKAFPSAQDQAGHRMTAGFVLPAAAGLKGVLMSCVGTWEASTKLLHHECTACRHRDLKAKETGLCKRGVHCRCMKKVTKHL